MRIGICLSERHFPNRKEWLDALTMCGFSALDYLGEDCGRLSLEEEQAYCKGLLEDTRKAGILISQTHAPILINRP